MNRAYEFRIYPTSNQETLIRKTIGSARKVYNLILSDNNAYYAINHKGKFNSPASYKETYPYLKEVDSLALTGAWMNVKKAFINYFQHRSDKPIFKSKKNNKQNYITNNINNSIRFENGKLRLPKLGLVDGIFHRFVEGIIKSVTVKMSPSGKFYVCILTEQKEKATESRLINNDEKVLGIDMSMAGFGVTNEGEKFNPPKWLEQNQKHLTHQQRKLSRQVKGSRNYEKQRIKVATIRETISNQRKDWLNKLSFQLAESYDAIVVEDINLATMSRRFGKSISQNGFGIFRQMLEYKMKDRLKTFTKADKFLASTQLCSYCGFKNTEVKGLSALGIREWECPICYTVHDRDINAAKNLVNYYVNDNNSTNATLGIEAHGDHVRPEMDAEAHMAVINEVRKIEGQIQATN